MWGEVLGMARGPPKPGLRWGEDGDPSPAFGDTPARLPHCHPKPQPGVTRKDSCEDTVLGGAKHGICVPPTSPPS